MNSYGTGGKPFMINRGYLFPLIGNQIKLFATFYNHVMSNLTTNYIYAVGHVTKGKIKFSF